MWYFINYGLDCVGFESGEEFLVELDWQLFMYVIIDVNFFGILGYEIGELFCINFFFIICIVMIFLNDKMEINLFLEKGFDDVLLKFVLEEDLLEVIELCKNVFEFLMFEVMIEDLEE